MPKKVLSEKEKADKEAAYNMRLNIGSFFLLTVAGPYVYYACAINAYA